MSYVHSIYVLCLRGSQSNGLVNKIFWSDKEPREGVYHTCIAYISIDSVTKMEKKELFTSFQKNYPEECKHKIKKIKVPEFKGVELEYENITRF